MRARARKCARGRHGGRCQRRRRFNDDVNSKGYDMSTNTSSRPGRPTRGVERIDDFEGSELAKARAKPVLLAVAGNVPIAEQLDALCVCRTRFVVLRERGLRALIDAMEPSPSGRRPKERHEDVTERRALSDEIRELRRQLHAAQVREEARALFAHRAAD